MADLKVTQEKENTMKTTTLALVLTAAATGTAAAESYPIFAAQCAGGVNQGGYNIDTDDRGHLWINGHKVNIERVAEDSWQAGYHGVIFAFSSTESGLIVDYTGPRKANGICTVVAQ